MPKRTPQDWEALEQELHAAGVSPAEIEAGARRLLAEARGYQLAEARKHLGLAQRDIAANPWRSAILLVAGDMSGSWRQWYRQAIPRAEQLLEVYLKERAQEEGEGP
jgi:hypothetical protein